MLRAQLGQDLRQFLEPESCAASCCPSSDDPDCAMRFSGVGREAPYVPIWLMMLPHRLLLSQSSYTMPRSRPV